MATQHAQSDMQFTIARENMVESQIKPGGVRDERLCRAMANIPREIFVPAHQRDIAYADCQLTMTSGEKSRELLMPHSFAFMAEQAALKPSDIVLDIAGGNGYASAVLSNLSATVIALEDDPEFSEKTEKLCHSIGIDNIVAVVGPLTDGQEKQAPFNVIFINGFVEQIPEALLSQLGEGGRLVCVSPHENARKLTIVTRSENIFSRRYGPVLAAPTLSAFNPLPEFKF
jgi:protein-L-isoaspartate(D-aspartate) O-methyltransferase